MSVITPTEEEMGPFYGKYLNDPFIKALTLIVDTWIKSLWMDEPTDPEDPNYQSYEKFRLEKLKEIHNWNDREFSDALPEWISEAVGAKIDLIEKGLMP